MVCYLLFGGGGSEGVPERKHIQMMLEHILQKRTDPTNETSNVSYSDSHSVWRRDKQQAKQV